MSGNNARKANTSDCLERKVLVLEAVASREHPYSAEIPLSMNALRDWTDSALGLTRIGSPSSTNERRSPHNAPLIDRAQRAIRQIKNMRSARKLRQYVPVAEQLAKAADDSLHIIEENRRLASELLRFKHLYEVSSRRLGDALAEVAAQKQQLDELRAELVRTTRTVPRRVK